MQNKHNLKPKTSVKNLYQQQKYTQTHKVTKFMNSTQQINNNNLLTKD